MLTVTVRNMFLTYGINFIYTEQVFLIMIVPAEFLLCDHSQNWESSSVQTSHKVSFLVHLHLRGDEPVLG